MAETFRRQSPKVSRLAALAHASFLIAILSLVVIPVGATGPKGMMVDSAGATFMSYAALVKSPKKFDGKPVWVTGGLTVKDGTAHLGELSSGKDTSQSVCVLPTESFADPGGSVEKAVLRRFDGLDPISVHGTYESATSPQCPNGTVFAALLEVSLE